MKLSLVAQQEKQYQMNVNYVLLTILIAFAVCLGVDMWGGVILLALQFLNLSYAHSPVVCGIAFSASLLLTSEHMLCFCHSVWGQEQKEASSPLLKSLMPKFLRFLLPQTIFFLQTIHSTGQAQSFVLNWSIIALQYVNFCCTTK